MDFLINLLPYFGYVLLAIMILVFVHEMGHFLAAKLFGMRVEKFSVGFPPKIAGIRLGKGENETEYVIGATPLGGYVKISGMVDESMDTENLGKPPEPWEFRAKPVWQRIVVITAGVIFNMILAWIIFASLKGIYGEQYIPAENVRGVYVAVGSLAHEMGLRTGDRIVAVGGERLERYEELPSRVLVADPLTVTVERDGQQVTLEGPRDIITRLNRSQGALGLSPLPSIAGGVVDGYPAAEAGLRSGDRIVQVGEQPVNYWPEMLEAVQVSQGAPIPIRFIRADSLSLGAHSEALTLVETRPEGRVFETLVTPRLDAADSLYKVGIQAPTQAQIASYLGAQSQPLGAGQAIAAGWNETWRSTGAIVTSLSRVFSGRDNFRENVGGPVAIAKATRDAAVEGWRYFWYIVAMLSITLAIMNILPIPALDGGHLVFLIYEAIARREPSLKVRMVMQQIGMAVLLLFMTFVIFNDVLKLF